MPVRGNILYCPECNHPQPYVNRINCEKCGHYLGAPNVNMVSTEEELNALQKRYDIAVDWIKVYSNEDVMLKFISYFDANVKAIKNLPLESLFAATISVSGYKSYNRLVDSGIRPIASPDDDKRRTVIDSYLYGSYGEEMNFAALTLNDRGLFSYGECAVVFNNDSIKSRASILEENSYTFVIKHKVNLETLIIPPGFRAIWNDKFKLAVAKVYEHLLNGTEEKDFSNIVLYCNGNRTDDQFLEVHIYKEITNLAVEKIFIPTSLHSIYVKVIEEKLPGKVFRLD